nr:hypothetical protein [uncultured Enterobacter sp.]
MPASLGLTRSVSDAHISYFRPGQNGPVSDLASKIQTVQSAAESAPTSVAEGKNKLDLLKFRDDYRANIATNVMSKFSDDFKYAYTNGDTKQRRELENVATAIYLARIGFISKGDTGDAESAKLGKCVDEWLSAIKKGNEKPDSHFTSEQNFSVNRKNKERDAYQKAVNNLGLHLKDNFSEPKFLAKQVMGDVHKKCDQVLSQYGMDTTVAPDFLEQTAFNAEKNMRHAVEHNNSTSLRGVDYLHKVTVHVNSLLNAPNYLRDVINAKAPPAANQPAAPMPPSEKPAAIPSVPQGDKAGKLPADNPAVQGPGPSPVAVNLSNIGNPVVNVNLGDQLDKLASLIERLVTQGPTVTHVHHYHISDCKHVHESSKTMTQFAAFSQTVIHQDGDPNAPSSKWQKPLGAIQSADVQDGDPRDTIKALAVSEPEISEPEVSEPEISEPEVSEPEISAPEISQPGADESAAGVIDTVMAEQVELEDAESLEVEERKPDDALSFATAERRRQSASEDLFGRYTSRLQVEVGGPARTGQPQNAELNSSPENKNYVSRAYIHMGSNGLVFEKDDTLKPRASMQRTPSETLAPESAEEQPAGRYISEASLDITDGVRLSPVFAQADAEDQSEPRVEKKKFYSTYLDENGNPRKPVMLTTDGLHFDLNNLKG